MPLQILLLPVAEIDFHFRPFSSEVKTEIDKMSHTELARRWRFGLDDFWCGESGDYATKRFQELGGFTPEISKQIGWDRY